MTFDDDYPVVVVIGLDFRISMPGGDVMPPLAANDEEMKLLAKYLASINEKVRAENLKLGHKLGPGPL